MRYSVNAVGTYGPCEPCATEDTVQFEVTIRNAGTFACTVQRNNGCVSDAVEIHGAGPHGELMSTEYLGCTEAIEINVLEPGGVLTGSVPLETEYGAGNYVAIASFSDHHNGEASNTFSLE